MKKTLLIGLLLLFSACVSKKKYNEKEQETISLKKELDSIRINGLLDNDGDGIIDRFDLCPTINGKLSAAGCPDTDNDGIQDINDYCPTVSGSANNNGCPEVSSPMEKIIEFCCTNHDPGHCATTMNEMKDLSTQYNCTF